MAAQLDGCTQQDLVLLKLTLGPEASFDAAWEHWCAIADFDRLLTGSLLVPAAYQRCKVMLASGEPLDRMQGAYRKNWLRSQLLIKRAMPLLEKLHGAGLAGALGDDLALAEHYYLDPATRPIFEVAVYTQRRHLAALANLIMTEGLPSRGRHAWHLGDRAILRLRQQHSDDRARAGLTIPSLPLPLLDPTAQFWASLTAKRPQFLLRMLDLGVLMRDYGEAIAWTTIGERATRRGCSDDLRFVLTLLQGSLDMTIPPEAAKLPLTGHTSPLYWFSRIISE